MFKISERASATHFCNECGCFFIADNCINILDVCCPKCGGWDVFENTPEGCAKSVEEAINYLNRLDLLED